MSDLTCICDALPIHCARLKESHLPTKLEIKPERVYKRGVYKLIRIENEEKKKILYGQFHVLFIKENGMWKILMDYDSNEANSIGEKGLAKAYGINLISTKL